MFLGGIKRDQWHERGCFMHNATVQCMCLHHAATKLGEEKGKNLQTVQCELGQMPYLRLSRSS